MGKGIDHRQSRNHLATLCQPPRGFKHHKASKRIADKGVWAMRLYLPYEVKSSFNGNFNPLERRFSTIEAAGLQAIDGPRPADMLDEVKKV